MRERKLLHSSGYGDVADITDAHKLLDPVLGVTLAGFLFAIALLASGQNSTLTGTLAGQIVMEGFINIRLKPWLRRLITRLIAITPAFIITIIYGEKGTTGLLILSQVILSIQLSFAVVPLVIFTNDKNKMGKFANKPVLKTAAWIISLIIICFNAFLLYQTFGGWLG
jgi:manganese transport protein